MIGLNNALSQLQFPNATETLEVARAYSWYDIEFQASGACCLYVWRSTCQPAQHGLRVDTTQRIEIMDMKCNPKPN